MSFNFTFTCFTPTYNRVATLGIVRESLEKQSFHDFEWLVVDDGSTDNTRGLVESWAKDAAFPIRYIYKKNGGMHTAINAGAREARGRFFIKCDSDDAFDADSLERFFAIWQSIPEEKRSQFAGVTVHCKDAQGRIVGGRFPKPTIDGTSLDLAFRWRVPGEKWGFIRTDIMCEFPFPEIEGERRMPPSLVWNRISQAGYLTRFADIALRTFVPMEDGITRQSAKSRAKSWKGSRLFYNELCAMPIPSADRLRAAVNFIRFGLHGGLRGATLLCDASNPALSFLAFIAGYAAFRRDMRQM